MSDTVDGGARPALRHPPPSAPGIAGYLHPAAPHAPSGIKWQRHWGEEGDIAKRARFEPAAAEGRIKKWIALECSVEVSEYRVEEDEWVGEAPWARARAKPERAWGIMERGLVEGPAGKWL